MDRLCRRRPREPLALVVVDQLVVGQASLMQLGLLLGDPRFGPLAFGLLLGDSGALLGDLRLALASRRRFPVLVHDLLTSLLQFPLSLLHTRALTRHLRELGAMKACLTTEEMSPEKATQLACEGKVHGAADRA